MTTIRQQSKIAFYRNFNSKNFFVKFVICLFILSVLISYLNPNYEIVLAEENDSENLQVELEETIYSQLENLDLAQIESVLKSLSEDQLDVFGVSNFGDKVKQIVSGEFAEGQKSIFSAVINLIFDDILSFVPLLASIIIISIICGFLSNLKSDNSGKGVGDIIHFVCYGVVISIVMAAVVNLIQLTGKTINGLQSQMEVVFPILLTIMTAIGGSMSVSIYQPAVALLSSVIMRVFTSVLMPIFIFSIVFTIISNLTSTVKLDKFTKFFQSTFKWIIGGIFTIFMAFLSIQGITASTYDGVSIRTAKYAIRSYVPILGGYLSEGFDVIMASSVLIKNAIGASGLLLMFSTIISPIVKIIVFILVLKLAAAILEPLTDPRISDFIYSVSKSLTMLIVMILGVAFMYLITVGLIMCTANFV